MTYRTMKLTKTKRGLIVDTDEDPLAPTLVYDTVAKVFILHDTSGRNYLKLSKEEAEYLVQGIKHFLETYT